ncbi:transposon Tn21 resolvase [Shigella boydii ATCC 9905]|nr:transposon Tn21 resolvase [Shigella boydii ATCC 9905]
MDVLTLVDKLSQKGIKVHFHKEGLITGDDNPTSKMILTIFSAVAEAERKMMLERQREGYEAAKAAGRVVGRGNGKAVDREGIKAALAAGSSIAKVAAQFNVAKSTVQRIKAED